MKRLYHQWLKSALLAGLAMTTGAVAWAAEGAAAAEGAEAAPPAMGSASMFYEMIFGVGIAHAIAWFMLFATSIAVVALVVDGFLMVRKAKLMPVELINGVRESLANGDLAAATAACQVNPSPLSRILQTGFSNIPEGYEVTQEAVASSAEYESEKILQRIQYLNVCGQLGPMIGLFGTVMGMISEFASLGTAAGAAKTAMLALGISTALWTTVMGIGVAIPALFFYVVFKNHATKIILEMQHAVLDLIKGLRNAEVEQQQ